MAACRRTEDEIVPPMARGGKALVGQRTIAFFLVVLHGRAIASAQEAHSRRASRAIAMPPTLAIARPLAANSQEDGSRSRMLN